MAFPAVRRYGTGCCDSIYRYLWRLQTVSGHAMSVPSTGRRWLAAVSGRGSSSDRGGGKAVGRSDGSAEDRKLLDSMQQLVYASDKATKYRPRFPADVAEKHRRIGAEYNKQTTIMNNKRDKDLQTKLYLMHDAINSLPEYLKEKAMIVDRVPPPKDRPYPGWETPPMKEFNIKDQLKKEASESVGQESSDLV